MCFSFGLDNFILEPLPIRYTFPGAMLACLDAVFVCLKGHLYVLSGGCCSGVGVPTWAARSSQICCLVWVPFVCVVPMFRYSWPSRMTRCWSHGGRNL